MQPQSDDSHCSAKPVRFVLEMRQGWFAKRGIKAGFRLRGKPFKLNERRPAAAAPGAGRRRRKPSGPPAASIRRSWLPRSPS
jgi:hypothetical protein